MAKSAKPMNVYLEAGAKKIFACAVDWPGWSRAGRDEASALQTLLDYAPRYASVLRAVNMPFTPPANIAAFNIIERVRGNAATDYGVPGLVPACDAESLSAKELKRAQDLLKAYWHAFDATGKNAAGKTLRTGPRGGGRDVEKMTAHVWDAQAGYLSHIAWKVPKLDGADPITKREVIAQAVLDALESAVKNGLPAAGPRGGKIWPARYFVRRSGWHILDHVWEIEDRLVA